MDTITLDPEEEVRRWSRQPAVVTVTKFTAFHQGCSMIAKIMITIILANIEITIIQHDYSLSFVNISIHWTLKSVLFTVYFLEL